MILKDLEGSEETVDPAEERIGKKVRSIRENLERYLAK